MEIQAGTPAFHRARNRTSLPSIHLYHLIHIMKKTFITLLALSGAAIAQDAEWTALTLNGGTGNKTNTTDKTWVSTTDGVTSVIGGQASLNWTEDATYLTSWKLMFTLTDSSVAAADLWSSAGTGASGTATHDPRGMILAVMNDGSLRLGGKRDTQTEFAITSAGVVQSGTPTVVTLSFVANVADEYYGIYNEGVAAGTVVGGTYTLTVGNETVSYTLPGDMLSDNAGNSYYLFYKNNETRFYCNGEAEKYSNIQLWKGTDNLIPEPATATLSLLALCGLAARRRRK